MKKHSLFLAGLALLGLASCSNDDLALAPQGAENVVNYSVNVPAQTRAADSYCNSSLPASFKVWGVFADDAYEYIPGDVVDRVGTNPVKWISQAGDRYWPDASKKLDFYAEVNGNDVFSLNKSGMTVAPGFNNFEVKNDVAQQVDLMYAVQKGQSRDNANVNLNFRHALTQVCFKAKSMNNNIRVIVKGIAVGHLAKKGTFVMPTTNTTMNYENHGDAIDDADDYNRGTWTVDANDDNSTKYEIEIPDLRLTTTEANISCPGANHANGWERVMTVLPQKQTAWNPLNKTSDFNGAYFLVKCEIYNEKGDAIDPVHDLLYGKEYQYAAIPVDIDWKQGKRYIYTFIFGEGQNGGYTPDPNDPKPVLNTVSYSVTVDDYINSNLDGTEMNAEVTIKSDIPHNFVLTIPAINFNKNQRAFAEQVKLTIPATVPEYIDANDATLNGSKSFEGWTTTNGGQTADYQPGGQVTIDVPAANKAAESTETVTLYPVWNDKTNHTYTVKTADNATVYTTTTWKNSIEWTLASPLTAPTSLTRVENGVTEEFKGWTVTRAAQARTRDAAAEEVLNLGDVLTINANNPVVTLTEKWVAKEKTTYKVIFHKNCANESDVTNWDQYAEATWTVESYDDSYTFNNLLKSNIAQRPKIGTTHDILGFDTNKDKTTTYASQVEYPGTYLGDTGTPVQGANSVTLTKANPVINLYAIWKYTAATTGAGQDAGGGTGTND